MDATLFFYFAHCCLADVFAGFLHSFGEVPYAVVEDDEVFAFFVGDYAAACCDAGEFGA